MEYDRVEGGAMFRTPPWKATNSHLEAQHAWLKERGRVLAHFNHFFYLSKGQNIFDPTHNNCKKN
jgi:hypothetical protein